MYIPTFPCFHFSANNARGHQFRDTLYFRIMWWLWFEEKLVWDWFTKFEVKKVANLIFELKIILEWNVTSDNMSPSHFIHNTLVDMDIGQSAMWRNGHIITTYDTGHPTGIAAGHSVRHPSDHPSQTAQRWTTQTLRARQRAHAYQGPALVSDPPWSEDTTVTAQRVTPIVYRLRPDATAAVAGRWRTTHNARVRWSLTHKSRTRSWFTDHDGVNHASQIHESRTGSRLMERSRLTDQ